MVEGEIHRWLHDDVGYRAIQALHGVGPITAAILVAEIGDIGRFRSARHLCSWAGMTPTLHESDTKSSRGHISKQGSTIVRWAVVEAVARYHGGEVIAPAYRRIAERRGNKIARVAAGQKTAHTRLLRAARRRHPLPASRGRVSTLGHSQDASSRIAVTPTAWWRGRRIE